MIRVILPAHLKNLARSGSEVELDVKGTVCVGSILDALEAKFPQLKGTVRDHATKKRRPMVRFYACQEDFSLDPPDTPLPDEVASGKEPLLIIGSIAGG